MSPKNGKQPPPQVLPFFDYHCPLNDCKTIKKAVSLQLMIAQSSREKRSFDRVGWVYVIGFVEGCKSSTDYSKCLLIIGSRLTALNHSARITYASRQSLRAFRHAWAIIGGRLTAFLLPLQDIGAYSCLLNANRLILKRIKLKFMFYRTVIVEND